MAARKTTTKPASKAGVDPMASVRGKAETPGVRRLRSYMAETNGGGSPESVPGFDVFRAATTGFETTTISGPTVLNSQPDGGFFSNKTTPFTAKPESVIGADGRVMVPDTELTPWRCICHLEVEYDRGPVGAGTGFFVGPRTIVTAAHVVVDRSFYGWDAKPRVAKRVRVVPGRNGSLAPYGVFVIELNLSRYLPEWDKEDEIDDDWPGVIAPHWFRKGDEWEAKAREHDYAALFTQERLEKDRFKNIEFGNRIGFFGLQVLDDQDPESRNMLFVNTAGYPHSADKPYGTLWYNAGRTSDTDGPFLEYMVDTEGGQSGSPVYYFDQKSGQRYVIAIHTIGDFMNRGIRVTDKVFDRIAIWADRDDDE